jgi:hypothetical protein
MIYFFTPYSFEKKLFEAYDHYMNLVRNPDDWVCFTDGDTAFLRPDFGMMIRNYTDKYPDTGMFTSYASRCHYQFQMIKGGAYLSDPSILTHKELADEAAGSYPLGINECNRRIAGHLMLIRKSTWLRIREKVKTRCADRKILGIDTRISYAVLNAGLKIRIMKGIYILHYLRMKEGLDYKGHLQ